MYTEYLSEFYKLDYIYNMPTLCVTFTGYPESKRYVFSVISLNIFTVFAI